MLNHHQEHGRDSENEGHSQRLDLVEEPVNVKAGADDVCTAQVHQGCSEDIDPPVWKNGMCSRPTKNTVTSWIR